jgi:small GTP-binding protein
MSSDPTINILILGGNGCGKTSLLNRFMNGIFSPDIWSTVGVDFRVDTRKIKGRDIVLKIWDTAGQERFDTIVHKYYPRCDGILLVIDLTNSQTAEDIRRLITNVQRLCSKDVPILVVGNKVDLVEDRSVFPDSIQDLPVDYIETSAKTDVNVDACFNQLLQKIL